MKRISALIMAVGLLSGTAMAQGETCATATDVGTSGTIWSVAGSTVGQTDDYNEECPYTVTGGVDEVWQWTPSSSGFIDIGLCQGTTNYDTKLYIYSGSCPTPGSGATGTQLACEDDACDNGATYPDPWISSIVNVPISAGTTYYIVVDGYGATDAGNYTLLCNDAAAPPTGTDLVQGEGLFYTYSYLPNYNAPASTFASVLVNDGSTTITDATSTVNVFSDADGFTTPIFTDASAPISMLPTDVDVVTGTTPFTPPGNGTYIFEFVSSFTGVDGNTSNDTFNAFLVVTDTFQERSQAFLGAPIAATRLAVLDPTAEYGVIQSYGTDVNVIGATILVSVDPVYLAEPITANLYEILGGDPDSLSLVATASVPADTSALVYDIPLSASLTAGDYILAYAGQSFPVNTDFIYVQGASDLLRAVVTGGLWGFFAGPYAWSQVLWTEEAAPACNSNDLPTNLSHVNLANRVELSWDPNPGAVGCQAGFQRLPSGPSPKLNILSPPYNSANVPYAAAGAGTTWMWRVRCACNISPVDATSFTGYDDTFMVPTPKEGQLAEVDLTMFPNPADNQLMVSFNTESNDAVVSVVDMLGRTAMASNEAFVAGQNNLSLDVSGLEPGTYFVRIEEGSAVRTEEFAVAR